jgi:hypothetical protein
MDGRRRVGEVFWMGYKLSTDEVTELARSHWEYVQGVIIASQGEDSRTLEELAYHYVTAFVHGYKYGVESGKNTIHKS